ncbi:hypothetical protein BC940DRAFT_310898 [Gongronella butleri]|nr:hypothetical protein BC940DRAFT_310898 [Gongronella butleri]
MKFATLLCLVLALIIASVRADYTCSQNAWIKVCVKSVQGTSVTGKMFITSGKGAFAIPNYSLMPPFQRMMGGTCTYDRNSNDFYCKTTTQWKSAYWSGIMNIEFDCNSVPYMGYSQDWKSYDYYCRGI